MNYKSNGFLAIVLLISGLIPVIFVASNLTKALWGCNTSLDSLCDMVGNDTLNVPPNPFGESKYIIEVRANLVSLGERLTGNISFTHHETNEVFLFEYQLGESTFIGGDIEKVVWTMQPGLYFISWENDGKAFFYDFSSAGIGYPNDFYILVGWGVILSLLSSAALVLFIMGNRNHKKGSPKTKSELFNELENDQSTDYLQKGLLFAINGQYDKALEFFDKSLIIFPKSPTVLFEKASILMKLRRYSEALDCVNKILELQPNSIKAQKLKSTLLDYL